MNVNMNFTFLVEQGNHNIISSPDEYSLTVQTARGPKDFQYDAVFTASDTQERVFEDTNVSLFVWFPVRPAHMKDQSHKKQVFS